MEGYVRLWRKIMNEPFYTNSKYYHLATHLILNANHKENIITFNNQEITIKRGQLITGTYRISELTGCTRQGIRSGLKYLERVKFITIKTTNKYSLITVNKYEEYQGNQPTKQPTDNQQITNKQPTDNQQITTNNNDNNDKNDKKHTTDTDLQLLMKDYKELKGHGRDDKEWDKMYFGRFSRPAKGILSVFDNNYVAAVECLKSKAKEFDDKNLSWTLDTILKHAADWKVQKNKIQKLNYLNMGA